MSDTSSDVKRLKILDAAAIAFSSYGFRKTSMDDIAREAGMSRPALYTRFRNKEDILRSLVQLYYTDALAGVRRALTTEGTVAKRLHGAFRAQACPMTAEAPASLNGVDILEAGTCVAVDLVDVGEAALLDLYADWLAEEMSQGRVDLKKSPDHVAGTLLAALKGLNQQGIDPTSYQARLETMAVMVSSGLSVR